MNLSEEGGKGRERIGRKPFAARGVKGSAERRPKPTAVPGLVKTKPKEGHSFN